MEEMQQSSSGLEFKLHPLVLINISDHSTRLKANAAMGADVPPSIGCLLGSHTGLTVEISNSFELQFEFGVGVPVLNKEYLATKQDQYKKVFPKLDVVGWYCTGPGLKDMHIAIHKMMMEFDENPVFLLLNPAIDPAAKDLPIMVYENEVHIVDGSPSMEFVHAKYSLQTSEAERIAVDQVTKIIPSGGVGSTQLTAHYTAMHSAMKMLIVRVRILLKLLERMKSGEVAFDHYLLRQITGLVRQLPAVHSKEFQEEFLTEFNDSLMVIYLSSITKGTACLNEIVDKLNVAYDKGARMRRGPLML